ncbi:methionine--tRNA ligase [Desulfosoma caldarium]|uniref:Methionine--tRNA ligase n=1 Tax=Desulfosoma caldarium TaxID=610254 RepID=A0A3N1VKI4_9BACT|nr:methionine--tRNA ligase [Desulfosoma caldarium]ROR03315.1 methionyl-tRNA synthetase [Desulfosoma caldarium]
MDQRFYITTPIYYVNAEPHIGHAYTTIVADVLNRFYRLMGFETYFLTGTDEHGDKIVQAAEAAGTDPKSYADRISAMFRETWPRLNISHDDFIRTTEPRHGRVVQLILQKVYEKGDIYFDTYRGRYCVGCERFITDRELVDGKCPDHDTPPVEREEANYFFRMSAYQEWLIEHIEKNPDFIRPERYKNEVLAFLREPLEDLCISRPRERLSWGIPLPFDERFVTYVWFDALINYVSGLGYPDGHLFKKFWPVAQHLIAKDILKPHGIYWPIMLKAAGIEPYRHLNVHGYWKINEGKMSKSRGTVVRPLDLAPTYGLDAFRYFLLREMVFGLDANFSEDALVQRLNADLANDLGNLFSRTLAMTSRYFGGLVPPFGDPEQPEDMELRHLLEQAVTRYQEEIPQLAFHKALMAIWDVINAANKYIDRTAPWNLAKNAAHRGRLQRVLRTLLEVNKTVAVLLAPFMPETAEKMLSRLGVACAALNVRLDRDAAWGSLSEGQAVEKGQALFPRVDAKKHDVTEKLSSKKPEPAAVGSSPPKATSETPAGCPDSLIGIEEFQRLDLRVGVVLAAQRIPKSKKLVQLTVDTGEKRQVVAGIGEHYAVDELVGKTVILVANLKPARLMGVESQGMILAAHDPKGLRLITTDAPAAPGSKVS